MSKKGKESYTHRETLKNREICKLSIIYTQDIHTKKVSYPQIIHNMWINRGGLCA